MSAKMRDSDQVAVCFFGEGALGQGLLYEVMNMASLWKLPVIYVCENNQYNEYTSYRETTAGDVASRAEAFGIHTETIDGQDVQLVHETSLTLVERARRGEGPAFLHCNTYRFHGHHAGDPLNYREKEEVERWRLSLHRELDEVLRSTELPEHPDYERANAFLIRARRAAASPEYAQ